MSPSSRHTSMALIVLSALVITGCGTGADTSSGGGGGEGGGADIPGISAELIADAQAEGEVVLYAGGHTRPSLDLLAERMQQLFGVQVTFTREDSGAIANSISAELASGSLNADVVSLTDAATMQNWADQGVITDADVPNLDDVTEGLDDPANPQVPYSLVPLGVMYNSAQTDPDELPSTWAELATGDFGTIVTSDPGASGTALSYYTMLDELYGPEWLGNLAQRQPVVTDSSLALAQLVLTGEADLGIPAIESAVLSAAEEGEPLDIAYMEDGVPVFATEVASLTDAPHPSAARLLMQYHLSEDFQNALVDQGARSVLTEAAQPPNAADLSEATLLSTTLQDVQTRGPDVVAAFAELFGR